MMKRVVLTVACVVLGMAAFAQQQAVVAVAPFEAKDGISARDANTITEIYSVRLAAARAVRVVTRDALDKVIREHGFQTGDWSDDKKTAALGSALNADWVVRGTLQKLGSRFVITVSVLDIRSLEIMGGADIGLASMDDAYDNMAPLVAKTVETLGGGRAAAGNAASHIERGNTFFDRQDYDLAIAEFTEAIRLNPNDADAYVGRGAAYYRKGDYDRAIADCTQAIRLDPDNAAACYNRGLAYRDKGDNDRAIADFSQAIRIEPNLALACYNRGLAYGYKGDNDRAIADFSQAIIMGLDYAEVYNNRGIAYYKKGDYDRAIADFSQALRIDPNDASAKTNLEIARRRGR
jgi:tetratricopeptide (TPR) repeat protein